MLFFLSMNGRKRLQEGHCVQVLHSVSEQILSLKQDSSEPHFLPCVSHGRLPERYITLASGGKIFKVL